MQLPKPWSLVLLSGMSVLFVAALLTGYGSMAISIVYGAGVVALSGVWFLKFRKRVANDRNV
jgi:uncharacterized membrane protein YuzA (DUF378 family)